MKKEAIGLDITSSNQFLIEGKQGIEVRRGLCIYSFNKMIEPSTVLGIWDTNKIKMPVLWGHMLEQVSVKSQGGCQGLWVKGTVLRLNTFHIL